MTSSEEWAEDYRSRYPRLDIEGPSFDSFMREWRKNSESAAPAPEPPRISEEECALRLLEAEEEDRILWNSARPDLFSPSRPRNPSAPPGSAPLSAVDRTREFWDQRLAERIKGFEYQPNAVRFIHLTWPAMREQALAEAEQHEAKRDQSRREAVFEAQLKHAAPVFANPDIPEDERRRLFKLLSGRTAVLFGRNSPQAAALERFQAEQENIARKTATERHCRDIFARFSELPASEALGRLSSPEEHARIGISAEEAGILSGMLRAKTVSEARQKQAADMAYAAGMAEQLNGLLQNRDAPEQGGVPPAGQAWESGLAAAYRVVTESALAPGLKHAALAAIQDGSFGRVDKPAVWKALFADLASGAATPHSFDAAYLRGGITFDVAAQAKKLLQTLEGPDGVFYRQGLKSLQRLLPPDTPPARVIDAHNMLFALQDAAAAAGTLAESVDPENRNNIVARSMRLVGLEPDGGLMPENRAEQKAPWKTVGFADRDGGETNPWFLINEATRGSVMENPEETDALRDTGTDEALGRDSAATHDILLQDHEPLDAGEGTLAAGPGAGRGRAGAQRQPQGAAPLKPWGERKQDALDALPEAARPHAQTLPPVILDRVNQTHLDRKKLWEKPATPCEDAEQTFDAALASLDKGFSNLKPEEKERHFQAYQNMREELKNDFVRVRAEVIKDLVLGYAGLHGWDTAMRHLWRDRPGNDDSGIVDLEQVDPKRVRLVAHAAEVCGVPPDLAVAVMLRESRGRPGAVSKAGARGTMQLMRGTFEDQGGTDIHDEEQNVIAGMMCLAKLNKDYGNGWRKLDEILIGYNCGEGYLEKYLKKSDKERKTSLPSETKNYIKAVPAVQEALENGSKTRSTGRLNRYFSEEQIAALKAEAEKLHAAGHAERKTELQGLRELKENMDNKVKQNKKSKSLYKGK